MGNDRGLRDQGTKLLPDIGMLLGKGRVQGDTQGQGMLIEEPANPRNPPMYRVLTKGLIDNVRISRSRIRSKVRAVPKTPHFNIENEADRDLLSLGPD